jgi:DNA mismatch repair protein MSH5
MTANSLRKFSSANHKQGNRRSNGGSIRSSHGASSNSSRHFKSSRTPYQSAVSPASSRYLSRSTSVEADPARPRVRVQTPTPPISDVLPHNGRNNGDDSLNEVIMAVDFRGHNTVGCCYYVARDEKIYFMEDVKLGGFDVVDTRTFWNSSNIHRAD